MSLLCQKIKSFYFADVFPRDLVTLKGQVQGQKFKVKFSKMLEKHTGSPLHTFTLNVQQETAFRTLQTSTAHVILLCHCQGQILFITPCDPFFSLMCVFDIVSS